MILFVGYALTAEPATGDADGGDESKDEALEVVIEARRDAPVVSEQTLDRERVLLTPGTFEDAVRLVQSLPGVAITPEYGPQAGDIAVRGAAPWETRYLLDGIELPYLYHFNGYSSVFPARLLDELVLYPSTFGAAYGDATGAIIDTHSTWQRPTRPRASANLNFVMAGGEFAVPSGDAWTARGSARRSYLDFVQREDEQYTVFPVFSDWYGRFEFAPTGNARWSLTGFGAADHFTRYAGEPTALDTYEQANNPAFAYEKSFNAVSLSHRHLFGTTRLDGSLAFTGYLQSGTLPTAYDRQFLSRLQLREYVTSSVAPWATLAGGIDAKAERLDLDVQTDRPWAEVERESTLLARGVSTTESLDRLIAGGWAEARLQTGKFRFVPGVRIDGDTLSDEVTLDPRLNARWQIGSDERLRLAVGQYSQFARSEWLSPVAGTPDLPAMVSRQAAFGFDYAIAQRLELELDAYAKQLSGMVDLTPGEAPRGGVEGFAYGAEVQLRYRLLGVFFASLGVSAGRSEREGVAYDYDQPYGVNLIGSWSFAPTWNVGLRYRVAAGLPYTPIVDGTYNATADSYQPVYGGENSARLPAYQKIDAHIQKDWKFRTWNLALYTELWLVPPGSNAMYVVYNYDYDDSAQVTGPVFIPLLGARGEFGAGKEE